MKLKTGKDIKGLEWSFLRGADPFDWSLAQNIVVYALQPKRPAIHITPLSQRINGNIIELSFLSSDCPIGDYNIRADFQIPDITLPGGFVNDSQDWANAFSVVEHSYQEDLTGATFTTILKWGINGLDADLAWLKANPDKTYSDYIAMLRQPATEAATLATDAAALATEVAQHPTYIGQDHYVYEWNSETKTYNKTDIYCKGDAFSIAKTYASVALMQADFDGQDTKRGDFVLIETGNVEDPDNSKLYVKGMTAWGYLSDLSGAIGFTGKTPQISIGTVTTGEAASPAVATLSEDGVDASGNPKFKLNFSIPQGLQGIQGIQGIQGETGKSSYQYYLEHTTDVEKLTEEQFGILHSQIPANEALRQQQEALRVQAEIYRVNSGAVIRSQIVNNLTESEAGKVLDARQGKVLNDNVSAIFDVIGWYGVSWDTAVSTTPMTRTGSVQMHRTLPIQSKMRGCLVSDSGVVTYLPATWSGATLDGSAGQVMVEIPQHYRYFPPANGTIMECRISEYPLPNFTLVPKSYISAYEATVARSTNKLSSVVNTTAEYRGGNNNAAWDANTNTLLGKPATNLTRGQFRTYARNRGAGWEMLDYKTYNSLFWLYFVEYANMNSQLAVNLALDGNGYKQGGLGNGVTDVDSAAWGGFNGYFPLIPCGASNSLGNGSGEVSYTVPFTVPVTTKVNRYRGIENPFGHIWKNCDGIIFDVKTDADGGTSNIYICSIPSNYSDSITANYTLIGQIPRTDGYVKALQSGSFLPLAIGGGSTTYWCDYFYQSIASSSLRILFLGGNADNGTNAGLGYSYTANSVTDAGVTIGSRLCFFPQ